MVAVKRRLESFSLFGRNASQLHQHSGLVLAATETKQLLLFGILRLPYMAFEP